MLPRDGTILVAGAGGFIGGWIVRALLAHGYTAVRAVDVKPLADWFQIHPAAQNVVADLRDAQTCMDLTKRVARLFNFACDMGGIGYIESHRADCMLSVVINANLLAAARANGVDRYLFASSACVYPVTLQTASAALPLRESDSHPAAPEDGYGWEKLYSEQMCLAFAAEGAVDTRIVRYHNVYGPHGAYADGREKAPAAICRKVRDAVRSGHHEIEIWGDGEQTRTFLYIADCVAGTLAAMEGDLTGPVNLGSTELVTINQLVSHVEAIAEVQLTRRYLEGAAVGVRGRNADIALAKTALGWMPRTSLRDGLRATYAWIAADGLTGDVNTALGEQILDSPKVHRETTLEPDRMLDHVRWEPVPLEADLSHGPRLTNGDGFASD